jgi:dTMP kinase
MIIQNFIVFEGGDGSGTSTQLNLLGERLALVVPRCAYHIGFEPTEGLIGRLIRSALRGEPGYCPETVARLFAADRGEHLFAKEGIIERAARGELVVSDRYVLSSLVYQGIACGSDLPFRLNEDFPYPELLFYFELAPQKALERIVSRPVRDQFEQLEFQQKVAARYETLLPLYGSGGTRIVRINAAQSVEEISAFLWSEVRKMPILSV